jgi:hypothetical protein
MNSYFPEILNFNRFICDKQSVLLVHCLSGPHNILGSRNPLGARRNITNNHKYYSWIAETQSCEHGMTINLLYG